MNSSFIYALGSILRQMVGFLMLPLYTRYLTPADYGVVGILTFSLAIIEPFIGGRLAQAVPRFFYRDSSDVGRPEVLSTAIIVTAATSLLGMLLLLAARNDLSVLLFGSDTYTNAVALFSTLLLTQAIEYYGLMLIRMEQRPTLFIVISIAKLIIQILLNVFLVVYLELGVLGVALSSAISSFLFALALAIYTLRKTGFVFDLSLAKAMLSYCWPLWFGGLAYLYISSSNRYFLRIFDSLTSVGLLELAFKFAAIVTLVTWEPFMQYWQTERFKVSHMPAFDAKERFRSTYNTITCAMILAALGICIFSPTVIQIMASPDFLGAGEIVPYLTLGIVFGCLTQFCSFSFLVTDNTKWIARNNNYLAIFVTVLYLVSIPKFGLIGASISYMVAAGAQLALTFTLGRKQYDMGLSLRPLFYMLIVFSVGYTISKMGWFGASFVALLSFKIMIFVSTASVVAFLFLRNDEPLRQQALLILKKIR